MHATVRMDVRSQKQFPSGKLSGCLDVWDKRQKRGAKGFMMEQKIPLVVVAGPTASGKTAAGVRLAQLLDGEVISADSMQIRCV